MNVSSELGFTSLTTTARVIAKMDVDSASDSRTAFIDSLIEEVSTHMGVMLNRHLLRTERTETYKLRRWAKTLTLDGADASITSIKAATDPSGLSTAAALVANDDYFLEARGGVVKLFGEQPGDPLYVEVTYTGGYFTGASEIGTKHMWLTDACEMQVLHRLRRQDTLGGNLQTIAGAGTSFEGAYNLLPTVRDVIRAHRKAPM